MDILEHTLINIDMDLVQENTTEQNYLDMAEDCKNRIEEKNLELQLQTNKNKKLKKILYKSYGIISYLREVLHKIDFEEAIGMDMEVMGMIEHSMDSIEDTM
tara:strand:+ start:150 stop:455 length:306 start_codon:yes stop_codon:yes gene_type:complete